MEFDDTEYKGNDVPSQAIIGELSHAERAILDRTVVCLTGERDTNIDHPGKDYATITLGRLFGIGPTRFNKPASLAFIPSSYNKHDARVHSVQGEFGKFVLLNAESDEDTPPDTFAAAIKEFAEGARYRVHTTANHRPGHDKVRGFIATQDVLDARDWKIQQLAFFMFLENKGIKVDYSLLRCAQHCYFPNVPDCHVAGDGTRTELWAGDRPLYYANWSDGHGGVGLFKKSLNAWVEYAVAVLKNKQEVAERKASTNTTVYFPPSADSPIARFNVAVATAQELEDCGYIQSPVGGKDGCTHWHSPYQKSSSFATILYPDGRWFTLSRSDIDAGIGLGVGVGGTGIDAYWGRCGDAFDLRVHYRYEKGEGKSRAEAFRAAVADALRTYGGVVTSSLPAKVYEQTWRDPETLEPFEYVIDDFLEACFATLAGAWGAGKTLNFLPIAACVAHLTPMNHELWPMPRPTLRRKVLYITEDVGQAQRILYSIMHSVCDKPQPADPPKPLHPEWVKEAQKWFIVAEAKRGPVDWIAARLTEVVAELAYTMDNGFVVQPLVVFDTQSANFDIANENDNSEVARVVATLRQALPKTPIVVIGHTTKANVTLQDARAGMMRGGGAWEADAKATFVMIAEREGEGPVTGRYLVPVKTRLPNLAYTELSFGLESHSFEQMTPWGVSQTTTYMHGVPLPSDRNERRTIQRDADALNRDREQCQPYLDIMFSDIQTGEVTSLNGFVDRVPANSRSKADRLLRCAVERGFATKVPLPPDIHIPRMKETYILPDTDVPAYFARIRDRLANG